MSAATRMLRSAPVAAAVILALAVPATAAAPQAVPDRVPLLAEPLGRAGLVLSPAAAKRPSVKSIDGRIGDWRGQPSNIGGTVRYDRGEHIYTDYLFDDFGADDGDDAKRLAVLGPVQDAESRTARFDQLFQAAGDQFDAPRPIGAPDHYGDGEPTGAADIREVRWSADTDSVNLLVRTTTMKQTAPGVLVLAGDATAGATRDVGFGTGLETKRFDRAILLTVGGGIVRDLHTGATSRLRAPVAYRSAGWTNAVEAELPSGLLPRNARVGVVTGLVENRALTPANVAYRFAEPVAGVYNDQRQALALHGGSVDEFATRLNIAALRRGFSQKARPGPGYAERQFLSGANISREEGEHGRWQPYGLYVPTSYKPGRPTPLTFWLHYRGGKAHSGGAWTPRLITQLGEETGNIVATPRGRGTSTWYVSESHQDFFEVFGDVHDVLTINANRRYLSGYSMGGYGTYLFGLLYPDLFAGGYSTSGAPTQGAWTGEGPDDCRTGRCFVNANDGDADAQLTYRILENARHFPITIHHGTDDELVPVTGIERIGLRLTELGYRHDLTRFVGYEHFTQAIVDEWTDGAQYLNRFRRDRNPRTVTYKVVPALVNAVNNITADGVDFNFRPDGAYWTDGLKVRAGDGSDPSVFGQLDATSEALREAKHVTVPRAGAVSPLGHSTPFVRSGLDWLALGGAEKVRNSFTATMDNLAAARLNVRRMALKTSRTAVGRISTDGPSTLTLTNINRRVEVILDGRSLGVRKGQVALRLSQGDHVVKLRPAS